jgi:hypothetical protein
MAAVGPGLSLSRVSERATQSMATDKGPTAGGRMRSASGQNGLVIASIAIDPAFSDICGYPFLPPLHSPGQSG